MRATATAASGDAPGAACAREAEAPADGRGRDVDARRVAVEHALPRGGAGDGVGVGRGAPRPPPGSPRDGHPEGRRRAQARAGRQLDGGAHGQRREGSLGQEPPERARQILAGGGRAELVAAEAEPARLAVGEALGLGAGAALDAGGQRGDPVHHRVLAQQDDLARGGGRGAHRRAPRAGGRPVTGPSCRPPPGASAPAAPREQRRRRRRQRQRGRHVHRFVAKPRQPLAHGRPGAARLQGLRRRTDLRLRRRRAPKSSGQRLASRRREPLLGFGEDGRALAGPQIVPHRLARLLGGAEGPQQIVAELERDAHRPREAVERRQRVGGRARQRRAQRQRAAHRVAARLEGVHGLDVLGAAQHVDLLADDDVLVDAHQRAQGGQHPLGRERDGGHHLERQVPREVAGEHRRRRAQVLPEALGERGVHRRPPAAGEVAIHPVVLDEQVGLEQLQRHAGLERGLDRRVGRDAGVGDGEQRRPVPLAPAEREIPRGGGHRGDLGPVLAEGVDAAVPQHREALLDRRADSGEERGKLGAERGERGHGGAEPRSATRGGQPAWELEKSQ